MADERHTILDVVEPLVASGHGPAGTTGTVVEAGDQLALVEISDDRGRVLDFVSLTPDALDQIGQMSGGSRADGLYRGGCMTVRQGRDSPTATRWRPCVAVSP